MYRHRSDDYGGENLQRDGCQHRRGAVRLLLQPWRPRCLSYTATAIGTLLGADLGNIIVAVALAFFAFTTIMAYYYYAETSLVYLFGNGRKEHAAIWVLRICILVAVIFGSVKEARVAWNVGDIGVGAMAWINIIVILLLSPQALRTLKDYERQQKEGREPEFNPRKLDIRNADFWDDSTKD